MTQCPPRYDAFPGGKAWCYERNTRNTALLSEKYSTKKPRRSEQDVWMYSCSTRQVFRRPSGWPTANIDRATLIMASGEVSLRVHRHGWAFVLTRSSRDIGGADWPKIRNRAWRNGAAGGDRDGLGRIVAYSRRTGRNMKTERGRWIWMGVTCGYVACYFTLLSYRCWKQLCG